VWQLVMAFVDVALHRRGPDDFPPSWYLLRLVLVAYAVVGLASLRISSEFTTAVQIVAVDTTLYVGFIWMALRLFGKVERFQPTAIALLGTGTLLGVLHIPLLLWNSALPEGGSQPAVLIVLVIVLLIWSVDVGGWVLSRTLRQPYPFGLLLMIVYVLTAMTVHNTLFPASS
jgi:hypothetical protein